MKFYLSLLLSGALLWGAAPFAAVVAASPSAPMPALANKQGGAKSRLLHKHKKDHQGEKTPAPDGTPTALV